MSTVAHPIRAVGDYVDPNVVKVVCDRQGHALYFSRAPIPHERGAVAEAVPDGALRHVGLYAYRAGFLQAFSALAPSPLESIEALEQLRVLWHGERIAVLVSEHAAGIGVDTPEDLERVRALLR